MSFGEFYAGFSGLGGNIIAEMERAEQKRALAKLGAQASSGDYRGAAGTAFDAGDLNGGLGLLKLGEAQEQRRLTGLADADFMRGFGGGFGGDAGGPQASNGAVPRPPSFAGGQSAMALPSSNKEIETSFIENLRAGGLTNPNGLAAAAAYASHESRYSPKNITGSWSDPSESGQPGTSGGILSWRGPRLDAMRSFTAGAADPVKAQAQFFLTENPALTMGLQNAKTPEEAHRLMADAWKFAGYNRAGGENAARLGSTRSYLERLSGTPAGQPQGASPIAAGAPVFPPTASGLNPGRPVQFADDENQTQVLEGRMGMYPSNVYGVVQPPQRVASADPGFAPQTPTAPGPLSRPMGAMPQGLSGAGDGRGALPTPGGVSPSSAAGGGAPAVAPRPSQAVPAAGDAPVQAPMQVMQAGGGAPQIPPDARIGQAPAAAVAQMPLGSRIPWLMRQVANPNLSDGPRQVAQTMLKAALDETAMPPAIKEFQYARANGYTQARTPAEYAAEQSRAKLRDPGADLTGQLDARAAAAKRYGLTGDAGRDYALGYKPGTERQTEAEKLREQARARRDIVLEQGGNPDDPRTQTFIRTGKDPREEPFSATDKKAVMQAEDQALQLDQTIETLNRAKELNGQTYSGYGAKALGVTGTSFPGAGMVLDPKKAEATREFGQIMSLESLKTMSQTLKGATTEREMSQFLEIMGDPTTPPAIRGRMIDRMLTLAGHQRETARARYDELRGGTYFKPGGGALSAGGAQARQGGSPDARSLPAPSPANRHGAVSQSDRFGQLTGSGMSKAQAFEQMHWEGY